MPGKHLLMIIIVFSIATQLPAQEPFTFLIPVGYDFSHLDSQTLHSPAAGAGFLIGEQDAPFTEVEHRFFGLALYQPIIFPEVSYNGMSEYIHQVDALFDGRINRHQLLFIFQSSSDRPLSGGLNTFRTAAGWGYEVIRHPDLSLILGTVLGVSDFGVTLPSGDLLPVMPLPLIRFGIDTKWFTSSFDFITGPNLEFTIAPKERIRFTADMRMDNYRSIADLVCEYTIWYRFFSTDHKLGDFAGIGAGFKNDIIDFELTGDVSGTFELRHTSIFAVFDLSILKIQGGWIFNSGYLLDGIDIGNPGRGFFISVQGIIPITIK